MTHQVASLKRQLEFSQMQVGELQAAGQATADAICQPDLPPVDVDVEQKCCEVGLFTCGIAR